MSNSLMPSLPTSGSYAITLPPSLIGSFNSSSSSSSSSSTSSSSKKRSLDSDEMIAFRYAFKPASITHDTPGTLIESEDKRKQLAFDTTGGGQQVFDIREEPSKSRECVLIWDEARQSFTLHPLPTTLHLTLNRTLSSSKQRKDRPTSPSTASTTSSASIPLQTMTTTLSRSDAKAEGTMSSKKTKPNHEVSPSSEMATPQRSTRGGKSLPTTGKPSMSSTVNPPSKTTQSKMTTSSKTKPAAQKKNNTTASLAAAKESSTTKSKQTKMANVDKKKKKKDIPPPIQVGKYKSAEIIEDSDEEIGDDVSVQGQGQDEEEEDEFARLVGESLADVDGADAGAGLGVGNEEEEESEEDEEDEDEDEVRELGGARLVVRDEGRGGSDGLNRDTVDSSSSSDGESE